MIRQQSNIDNKDFKEYPKVMHHPRHQDAQATIEHTIVNTKTGKLDMPMTGDAKPQFLPDITVHSLQQEEQAAQQGYVPAGTADPEAYRRAVLEAEEPQDHVHRNYPKWKYHATEEPVVVANEAEEKALGRDWHDTLDGPYQQPETITPYINAKNADVPADARRAVAKAAPKKKPPKKRAATGVGQGA